MGQLKARLRQWWYKITHVPAKPPKTLDLIQYHLNIIEKYYKDVQGEPLPIEVRKRYKLAIAHRRAKIKEIGFRPPLTLKETQELKSWIIGRERYGI